MIDRTSPSRASDRPDQLRTHHFPTPASPRPYCPPTHHPCRLRGFGFPDRRSAREDERRSGVLIRPNRSQPVTDSFARMLRRQHSLWIGRRIVHEIARLGVEPVPWRMGVHRALVDRSITVTPMRIGIAEPVPPHPAARRLAAGCFRQAGDLDVVGLPLGTTWSASGRDRRRRGLSPARQGCSTRSERHSGGRGRGP